MDPTPVTFDHVLLTRFSAVLFPGQEAPEEDWLYYRLGFFYDACLPSVRSQRGAQPFQWFVMLDDRCSDGFREEVEQLADCTFTPIWTHEPFQRTSFGPHVAATCHAPYLISTRIDSDDAMAVDFMAAVQAQFEPADRLFVNFPRGVQIDRTGAVYRSDILSSPFLSMIERRAPGQTPSTVYVAKHARARHNGPLREVRAPVMWAQVLHGTNLSNIVNGVRVHPKVIRERFEFDLGYDSSIRGGRLYAEQVKHLGRLARLWSLHPGELTKFAEASAWTVRGTHERPQDDGARTITDAVQDWEQDTRAKARGVRWRMKTRANQLIPRRDRLVAGDLSSALSRDEVVVLAEWAPGRRLRPDALRSAVAYAKYGLGVVVVAARDPWAGLAVDEQLPEGVAVLRRPNLAYDFGSWAHAITGLPALMDRRRVVLTNDSLIGPLGPLDELLSRMRSSDADVWAATLNAVPQEHLQSFFLSFTGSALASEPLQDFFSAVAPTNSKQDVIRTYELGLTNVIDQSGLTRDVGWTAVELGRPDSVHLPSTAWRELVAAGFPFVKRSLTSPPFSARYPDLPRFVADRLSGAESGNPVQDRR